MRECRYVRLHAILKKHLPPDANGTAVIELPDGASVADLIAHLKIPPKHTGMMVSGDEYLETTTPLREGQEVNLFPPLAGGCPALTEAVDG